MGQRRGSAMAISIASLMWILGLLLQGSTAQPTQSCLTSFGDLATPCDPYFNTGVTATPSPSCCNPMGALLLSDPTCICDVIVAAAKRGTFLNTTRLNEIFVQCQLTVPAAATYCLPASPPSSVPSISSPPPTTTVTPSPPSPPSPTVTVTSSPPPSSPLSTPPPATAPSGQPSENCIASVSALSTPCESYFQPGVTAIPSPSCCNPIDALLFSDPTCICDVVVAEANAGTDFNRTRLAEVFDQCEVTVPAAATYCLPASPPSAAPSISSPPPPKLARSPPSPTVMETSPPPPPPSSDLSGLGIGAGNSLLHASSPLFIPCFTIILFATFVI